MSKSTLHVWLQDLTEGSPPSEVATIESQYDNWGRCPAEGETAEPIRFSTDHVYLLVVVDPTLIGCDPPHDPSQAACQKFRSVFRGDEKGIRQSLVVA